VLFDIMQMAFMHQESCAIKFWSLCDKSVCRDCAAKVEIYNSPCPICNRPGIPVEEAKPL
jgi:hypothetical protein